MLTDDKSPVELAALSLGRLSPELAHYQQEPQQMSSAAVGKRGYLRLKFVKKGRKSVLYELERKVPLLAQKALYWDEEMPFLPCVAIVSTSGCILQGDRLSLEIEVAEGACAHVTTQSATKIHSMDGNYAAQVQCIRVGEGSYLEFMPDPVIPHRHSRFINETVMECADNATMIYSEVLMSGRKYHHHEEHFGFDVYSSRITLKSTRGETLFTEKMILEPKENPLNIAGVMGRYEIYGNVVVITNKAFQEQILKQSSSFYSLELCYGVSRLPNECGLIFKALSCDSRNMKRCIRQFWQVVRQVTTGYLLPAPFIWKT